MALRKEGGNEFRDFLKRVRSRYPTGKTLHRVLDKYSPHVSSSVLEWAKEKGAVFYFTRTNASWLNRIECHSPVMKKFALAGA